MLHGTAPEEARLDDVMIIGSDGRFEIPNEGGVQLQLHGEWVSFTVCWSPTTATRRCRLLLVTTYREESPRCGVEVLQQIVSRKLDLFVPPFRRAVDASDQGRTVHASEVAVHERIAGLRLIRGTLGEAEMPGGVLLPRVALQECVLASARGCTSPQSLFSTYCRVDQPTAVLTAACSVRTSPCRAAFQNRTAPK